MDMLYKSMVRRESVYRDKARWDGPSGMLTGASTLCRVKKCWQGWRVGIPCGAGASGWSSSCLRGRSR